MAYEGMETVICDAEENDWLSVSYHEQKYVNEGAAEKKRIKMPHIKLGKFNKKIAAIALIAALCVAALACMLFIDGNFSADVFGAVKTAYSSTVFKAGAPEQVTAKITLPCNVTLKEVSEQGVATFCGGRAVTSFTAGKVSEATENSVTVAIDESTSITYQGLAEVYVSLDDIVSANALLGKYDGEFTATVSVAGETKQVVGSESQLTWNV